MKLSTQVGQPYDTATIEHDVRYLWSLGRFEDIRVETSESEDGEVAVVFHAVPRELVAIHEVRVEPNTFGVTVFLPEGTRIDRQRAQAMATEAQKSLQDRGYADAKVSWEFVPVAHNESDLKLAIDTGDVVRVQGVEFHGDTGVSPEELRRQLRALRPKTLIPRVPHMWNGWHILPSYTQSAADADVARLRSYYFFKGYFNSDVQGEDVASSSSNIHFRIEVNAGPRQEPPPANFCTSLLAQRREAERKGILDFSATATVDDGGHVTWTTELGQPYRVGRIQFFGNQRYSDGFIRRNFVIDETDLFDERRMRQSLVRINRSNAFETLDDRSVVIVRHPETGTADINVRIKEKKHGSWSISGPVGPMSFAGPLQGSISMRLPSWGKGILELSTYAASFSVIGFSHPLLPFLGIVTNKHWLPVWSLQRPYTPGEGWKSGFSYAPLLGWRYAGMGYVATQLQQRLIPVLNGNRGLDTPLPVTVHRPAGDTMILCEPPGPRLGLLRSAAGMGLEMLGALSGI